MDLEEATDILYDGTEEQIRNLPKGVSYSFSPEYRSMHIRCGNQFSKGYGSDTPNCVKYFGNEYSFGEELSEGKTAGNASTVRVNRVFPPVPVFDAYIKQYGLDYVVEKYCDENYEPTDECPEDLKADMLKLKAVDES